MQRLTKVDGNVRNDTISPVDFMDVILIEKTGTTFRLVYGVKEIIAEEVENKSDYSWSASIEL